MYAFTLMEWWKHLSFRTTESMFVGVSNHLSWKCSNESPRISCCKQAACRHPYVSVHGNLIYDSYAYSSGIITVS